MVVVIEVHCFECFSLKVSEEIKPQKSISSFLCIGTSVGLRKKWKKKLCTLKYLNGWTATAQGHTHKPKSIHAKHPQKRNAFPHTKHWIQLWAEKIVFSCFICFSSKNNNNNSEHQHNCVFFFNGIKFGSIHLMSVAFFVSLCPVVSHFGYTVWSAFSVFVVNLRDRAMFQKNLYIIIMCMCFGYLGAPKTLSGSHTSVKLRKKTKRTMLKPMHMNEDQIKWTDKQTNENTGKEDMTKPS